MAGAKMLAAPMLNGTLTAIALLVLALQLPVGTELFPQNERDQFVVDVWFRYCR